MAQVLEFKLPDLGEGLTEAEITRWLVQVGDVVEVDQPVVEVETAKAMVEVPCPYAGVITARFGEEGTELPVGAPLLTVAVGTPAVGAPASGGAADDALSEAADAPAAADESSGNVLVGYGTGAAPARRRRIRPARDVAAGSPAARREAPVARAEARAEAPASGPGRSLDAGHGTGSVGHSTESAGHGTEFEEGPVPVISPLVRKLARENGVDLRDLAGSGPDGLILRADVEDVMRAAAAAPLAAPAPATATARTTATGLGATFGSTREGAPAARRAAGSGTRVPLRGVRGAVADKLSRSRREIPDATTWVDADATELMHARVAMNAAGGPKVSLLALFARICTAALARHPELNSRVDMEAREIVQLDEVHLGFAAQTERGLVVPVVRDAHARDTESLSAEFARLSESARAGTLTPGELTGSTFTLNNYGVFGVDGSTPIINHPEAAMLGVGRIVPKPWVHQGELAVRQVVQLSLTFDHRVCDGGTAGGFLRFVADCVEQPAVLLRKV
ncbi:dihydrolipoamide acetyltransferase family protein [Streptomyces spectabilis]|uniref:Dihydrolipoamide acetyltransferase component of pyruvate dehydrogenase complex n=1 Tax=Streptomyces spectabilis TaxID=68270 RepID=A0A5P2XDK2_STRST|nr:dihydrolipoamide acetyltransferase family protein [Streptomyces spectabilis]MBB5103861.1 pyruvate dehydrogenase E2 component (dihydrolipoamide acetyltransferase) [Streptomyces spectabilis]MCI3903901.1 2-oxo acid dehydrogenase subunit E2 [Streptomyces spectabilis]QEV61060.1 2-oxo acid dehydrogenase subunit E2 [Streptomyces spectabilis]GGV18382.1 dihydrolipoamide acetyltransferase component of pyruvate dehydrogenase complex [Streptomyces spectabilis]